MADEKIINDDALDEVAGGKDRQHKGYTKSNKKCNECAAKNIKTYLWQKDGTRDYYCMENPNHSVMTF